MKRRVLDEAPRRQREGAAVIKYVATSIVLLGIAMPRLAGAQPEGGHPRIWLDRDTRAPIRGIGQRIPKARWRARCGAAPMFASDPQNTPMAAFKVSRSRRRYRAAWLRTWLPTLGRISRRRFNTSKSCSTIISASAMAAVATRWFATTRATQCVRLLPTRRWRTTGCIQSCPMSSKPKQGGDLPRGPAGTAATGIWPDVPGANYQAGYIFGATLIAIAQAGDAGAAGAELWQHVIEQIWMEEMATALEPGGVLDGGDWGRRLAVRAPQRARICAARSRASRCWDRIAGARSLGGFAAIAPRIRFDAHG